MFNKPTIVTITGPSGCGKSHMITGLQKEGLVERLITTTTRAPRAHEKDGEDYHFLDRLEAMSLLNNKGYIEHNIFNGHVYGITRNVFVDAMQKGVTPAVVIEPNGVTNLEKACWEYGFNILKAYVHTEEKDIEERLRFRMYENLIYARGDEARAEVERDYEARLKTLHDEQRWIHTHSWDVILDGKNFEKSLELFNLAVTCKNKKGYL